MPRKEIDELTGRYLAPFRIAKGKGFKLKKFDPSDTCGLELEKGQARELLQRGTERLAEQQDKLFAQDRWSVLLIFQAMDAAGKDSTIKHVMSGSILKDARWSHSSSHRQRNSTTTSCGGMQGGYPSVDA